MTSEVRTSAEHFANLVLKYYFSNEGTDFLVSTFASDIIWIGADSHQRAEGKKAVTESFLASRRQLTPCRPVIKLYETVSLGTEYFLCEAEAHGSMVQRITLILRRNDSTFEIVRIQSSVPAPASVEDGAIHAHTACKTHEQMKSLLIERTQQIELMLPQLPGGMAVYYMDETFSTKWISEGLCEILGYRTTREYAAATGNCCRGYILLEDYEQMKLHVFHSLTVGNSYSSEYRVRRNDGEIRWVLDVGKHITDSDGDDVVYCFITDVTKHKEQESELMRVNSEMRRQADFLNQLYSTVPCGIIQFTTDDAHRILHANNRAWEIYGYPKEAEWNDVRSPLQFVLKEDQAYFHELVDHLAREGGQVSYMRQINRLDKAECYISVTMHRLTNTNGSDVIQAVFSDVTESIQIQKEREQEHLLENQILRAAIFTAYPLIMRVNLTQNTFDSISTGTFLFRIPAHGIYDELIQTTCSSMHSDNRDTFLADFCRNGILSTFRKTHELYAELRQMSEDGVYHWIAAHVIHVDNPYGDDVLAIILFRLLDEQRAEQARQKQLLRDALTEAETANNAKSDFLSRMSHDIRTPMNAIIGMSAIGQLKAEDPEQVRDCFQKINASSQYLLSLINDILDMSKIEHGKMVLARKPFDFSEFMTNLNAIIYPQAEERGIHFSMEQNGSIEKCYIGDPLRIDQILMNLLSNALKFTPSGGHITLTLQEQNRANGYAHLQLSVKDDGIGMSEEFMTRLFHPFEQENADVSRDKIGSGLGLSIVHNLVQVMNGSISVKSQIGCGSEFILNIPLELCQDGETDSKNPSQITDPSLSAPELTNDCLIGRRVLLVDDNNLNLEIAKALLELQSITVDTAENGQLAVECFLRAPENEYLAILMDIRMPVMNGLEAARAIRASTHPDAKTVPIIALSANAFDEEQAAAFESGMNEYFVKPVDMNALFHALRAYAKI